MYPLWALTPGFVVYLIFFIAPFLMAFYYSFTNWDFYEAKFIGLDNYRLIFEDADILGALKNTVLFTVVTSFFKMAFGLAIAIFVNQKLRTSYYFRTVLFLPAILNTIAVGIFFTAILHPTKGMLNQFFGLFGLNFLQQYWLTDVHIAMYSISAIEIWKWTGYNMIILLAGLQAISKDYYESAEIDGASAWSRFYHITLPLLVPTLNVALVGNLIGGLKVFDIVAATTGGGPGRATEVLNSVIFESFGENYQGLSSAGNVVLCLLVAVVSTLAYLLIRRKEVEQ
jgi:raffinose/stachyose/melibiose transport system permease protein